MKNNILNIFCTFLLFLIVSSQNLSADNTAFSSDPLNPPSLSNGQVLQSSPPPGFSSFSISWTVTFNAANLFPYTYTYTVNSSPTSGSTFIAISNDDPSNYSGAFIENTPNGNFIDIGNPFSSKLAPGLGNFQTNDQFGDLAFNALYNFSQFGGGTPIATGTFNNGYISVPGGPLPTPEPTTMFILSSSLAASLFAKRRNKKNWKTS